jgi:hypothetical protein
VGGRRHGRTWEEGTGEAKSAAPRGGVERSGHGTQRKAAGSAWLNGQCEHRGCSDEENCETSDWVRRKRNRSVPFFR